VFRCKTSFDGRQVRSHLSKSVPNIGRNHKAVEIDFFVDYVEQFAGVLQDVRDHHVAGASRVEFSGLFNRPQVRFPSPRDGRHVQRFRRLLFNSLTGASFLTPAATSIADVARSTDARTGSMSSRE
jgi:hypothetical protein